MVQLATSIRRAMSPIDHLDLVVTALGRSLELYRGLLQPLGYVRTSEIASASPTSAGSAAWDR